MTVGFEPARQGLQLAAGGRRARRPIRPAQGRAHEGLTALRDQGEQVALLVQLAALDDRPRAQHILQRLRTPLPPSITHSSRSSRPSPRLTRSWRSSVQIAAFSVEPSRIPSGVLLPSTATPRATISV
jgi:hypothetical protein